MRRVLPAVIALLVLSAFIYTPLPAGGETVYFSAVNYTVNPFDAYHMPWPPTRQGIMIPHTALTGERLDRPNGLNLRSDWSPGESYFTLSDNREQLTFVVGRNTAFSQRGDMFAATPVFRDIERGIFYVPLALVSEVFGYTYGVMETDAWGTMVRVRSGRQVNDENFIRTRGQTFIRPEYEAYIEAQQPPATPGVAAPSPSPTPAAELFDVAVYLTFDGAVGDATPRILDFLEEQNIPALFFLPPDSLAENPGSVRRIAARHQIGLFVEETQGEALERGNALLRETAFIKTWLLRSSNAPTESTGFRYWGYSHRFSASDTAQSIVRTMTPLLKKTTEPSEALVFSFPHTDAAAAALAEALALIERSNIWRVNPGEIPVR
jgi:hypothetical protein